MKMELTHDEQLHCILASVHKNQRYSMLDSDERVNKHTPLLDYIWEQAQSIGSEWVVAKYFGVEYDPYKSNYKQAADVGSGIEVKWTKYPAGQLILNTYDRADDVAVLVTGIAPTFHIVGWIPVTAGKTDRYKHTNSNSWWITQINLQPIKYLARSKYANCAV